MQGLSRSCSEPVLLSVVAGRQPGRGSADLLLWAWVVWLIRCFGPVQGVASHLSGAHPPQVSVVGTQSANLGAYNLASVESWGWLSQVHSPGAEAGSGTRGWGCLSGVHSPGPEWGGETEAEDHAESSLTSH